MNILLQGTSKGMPDTLTYDTLRSRTGRQHSAPNEVPPLAITLDADQLKYQKQMSRRQESQTVAEADLNEMQQTAAIPGDSQITSTPVPINKTTKHQL